MTKKKDTAGERRRFVRLDMQSDVVYTHEAAAGEQKETVTKNIGKGGLRLIVYEPMKLGDALTLRVYLPEQEEPIEVTGKVAWIEEFEVGEGQRGKRYDVGIEFLNVRPEDMSRIEKHIFTHL